MTRVLKPGPRPFIAFSIMFGLLLCLPIFLAARTGKFVDAAKIASCFIGLYAVLCFGIRRGRIVVTDDFISFTPPFGGRQTVLFSDIQASFARVLAEPEHPVSLDLCADSGKRTEDGQIVLAPLLSIGLKSFRQSDVAWLLSLPALRIQR